MTTPLLPQAFTRLAQANLLAQGAEQLAMAALPIVAVLQLRAGPAEVGALAAAQSLPFLLLAVPLGLLADRRSRRQVMLAGEALRVAALLALLGALLLDRMGMPLLWLLGFLGATGTVAISVAAPAIVPALVAPAGLAHANARLELARSAAFAAGPALGGALVGWAGAGAAFTLATLGSLVALALLARLPADLPQNRPAGRRRPLAELHEGAALVWAQPLLRPVLLTAVVWNLAWCVLQAAYVPYALRALGLDAAGVGFTLAAYGIGMVCGSLVAARLVNGWAFGHVILLGPWVSVLAMAVMVATLVWPSGLLAGGAFLLFGAGPIVWTVSSTTLRQTLTPPGMLSRVSAIFLTANTGARPLGALLGGAIGSAWGEATGLWLALALFVAQALLVSGSRLPALQALQALPARHGG
ncbi:MAG: MFS transporter [Burkholderiaceae bacterium]|nr:MFS transporter [Burkholderiaceae bacterium]